MAANDTQTQTDAESPTAKLQIGSTSKKSIENFDGGDLTDGRLPFDWQSKYDKEALAEISVEGAFLFFILLGSLFLIFATWIGWINSFILSNPQQSPLLAPTLKRYAYFTSSGMLGGIVFGIKYFYHVVAKGGWHQDRRPWRLMAPFLGMSIALVFGAMTDASIITTITPTSGAGCVATGFLAGYFADRAVAKMSEVAGVVFGKSSKDGK